MNRYKNYTYPEPEIAYHLCKQGHKVSGRMAILL